MMTKNKKAQTAVEYLLLLTTVAAVVLIGFRLYLPKVEEAGNIYYNRAAVGVLGAPPFCGDEDCDLGVIYTPEYMIRENCCKCPVDCGECPAYPMIPGIPPYGVSHPAPC